MKKNYILGFFAFLCLSATSVFAQSPKMVFVEEFTQASCGPCASFNPGFDNLLDDNDDKVVVIKYQTSWPGFDQMYLDNPAESDARVSYYGVNGVPSAFINANEVGTSVNQSTINSAYEPDSNFDLSISASGVNGLLTITGNVKANAAMEGDLRLRIAITEKRITSDDAPGGSNGETQFHHVMKKFVGGTEGINFADTWSVDQTMEINETFNLNSITIYNYGELEVVAWIQDDNNKNVYQAAKDSDLELSVSSNNNASFVRFTDLPPGFCSGSNSYSPTVEIQNVGNQDITAAVFEYSVNDGATQTYEWEGDAVELYDKVMIDLDPIVFEVNNENTVLEVNITSVNNGDDEDTAENSGTTEVEPAKSTKSTITITVNTDCWGGEFSVSILDENGDVFFNRSNFGNEAEHIDQLTLLTGTCYYVLLEDEYGDGLHGSQYGDCDVDGNVLITDQDGNEIYNYNGSYDYSEETKAFQTTLQTGVDRLENVTDLSLSPNPSSSELNITFGLEANMDIEINIINAVGQQVALQNGAYITGSNFVNFDVSSFAEGIYFINLRSENKVITRKFVVAK